MKRLFFFFIVCIFNMTNANSQGSVSFIDKDFIYSSARDPEIDSMLSNSEACKKLSPQEKETIYWINFVRKEPKRFNSEILTPFLKQFPEVKSSYSRSLLHELSSIPPAPVLLPHKKLNEVAAKHAKDLGSTGSTISHSSSYGASFQERMNQAGLTNCVAENVYEGKQQALQAIIFLLIDNGVKNLGHRKNILSPDNKYIGLSFYPIKNKKSFYFLVQNFLCE
ncbi:MAG: CAP domain-containing protein [Chitinophagaceae bacterium]|nr:CAP domain-containing protein [Chitinophagaceae bacterium]